MAASSAAPEISLAASIVTEKHYDSVAVGRATTKLLETIAATEYRSACEVSASASASLLPLLFGNYDNNNANDNASMTAAVAAFQTANTVQKNMLNAYKRAIFLATLFDGTEQTKAS